MLGAKYAVDKNYNLMNNLCETYVIINCLFRAVIIRSLVMSCSLPFPSGYGMREFYLFIYLLFLLFSLLSVAEMSSGNCYAVVGRILSGLFAELP